jgi:hypothetical protein
MRKPMLAAFALACALGGCTPAEQAQFQADVAQFNADVALVDSSIATVSTALANNCNSLVAVGQALTAAIGSSNAAGAGLAGVDAAIESYCQAHPANISSAITATAAAIAAGKTAQAAAKAGN